MSIMASPAPALPLLDWPEVRQAVILREERLSLMSRMAALPRHSHKRVVLQARLQDVTAQLLAVEARLEQGASRHGLRT